MRKAISLQLSVLSLAVLLAAPAFAARNFNGTSDYINAGTSAANLSSGAMTVCAWVYPTSLVANATIAGRWDVTNQYLLVVNNSSGQVLFGVQAGSGTAFPTGSVSLTASAWSYVCGLYDGSNAYVYVNGVAGSGAALTGALIPGSSNFGIGGRPSGSLYPFQGRIAEVAVWNVALSSGEISALAHGAPPSKIRPGNLVGYWPLHGFASPEPDLRENSHNGTLTGTTEANHCPCGH